MKGESCIQRKLPRNSMVKRTIVITGARGGMGKDAAFALAKRGHNVIATTRTQVEADELAREARQQNVELKCEKLDILDDEDYQKIDDWKPDVLVNNAAVGESGPLAEIPMKYVRSNFETNVFGTIAVSQRALKHMIERGEGRVIVISSVGGMVVMPYLGAYNMTKFSLEAAVDAWRQELKHRGIKIIAIEPGAIETGFNERMNASKYKWFNSTSQLWDDREKVTFFEDSLISGQYKTDSITRAIQHAVESEHPLTRYIKPWHYFWLVALATILPDPVRDWMVKRFAKS